jgi:hypothetical protein
MLTRRQWLFKNPPPSSAERFTRELYEAKEELRAAMAETGAVVLEMFAAASVRHARPEPTGVIERAKRAIEERKEKRKLVKLAQGVAYAISKRTNGEEFEKQGDELVERLEKFKIQQSRELLHALQETRIWRKRIAELKDEIANSAKCSIDDAQLMRTGNRKEDLFVCTAPITEDRPQHYFLWTLVGGQPGFRMVDLAKDPLPDLDGPMEGMADAAKNC